MRRLKTFFLSAAALLIGCNIFPASFILPPDPSLITVVGGISNTDPFFGTFKLANAPDVQMGEFLLASCGCGDWRVLFRPSDGSPQTQFPVRFYTAGEYSPAGTVAFHGLEDYYAAAGTVDQDGGGCDGKAELALSRYLMNAQRASAHNQAVEACGLCHIGEDSIFPLPPTHPQKYKTDPHICFECHSVNGQ